MYTLTNNFHNTETKSKYSPAERDDIDARVYNGKATPAEKQARKRAWNKLCGISDCQCSNGWGERPCSDF
jgi:hypothetical protein